MKQIGLLYHFTTPWNALDILWDDCLKVSPLQDNISFTRNPKLYQLNFIAKDRKVRFCFDGDKLSHHYKIKPYNYFGAFRDYTFKDNHKYDQYEEIIDKINVTDLSKYIVKIDIISEIPFSPSDVKIFGEDGNEYLKDSMLEANPNVTINVI